MKLLSALLGLIVFLVALVFTLSNRQDVTVSLWPFADDVTAPLYALTLGALAAGMILGGFFVWLTFLPHKFRAKRLGKDVTVLSSKILELEQELEQHREKERVKQVTGETPPLLEAPKWRFWQRF